MRQLPIRQRVPKHGIVGAEIEWAVSPRDPAPSEVGGELRLLVSPPIAINIAQPDDAERRIHVLRAVDGHEYVPARRDHQVASASGRAFGEQVGNNDGAKASRQSNAPVVCVALNAIAWSSGRVGTGNDSRGECNRSTAEGPDNCPPTQSGTVCASLSAMRLAPS